MEEHRREQRATPGSHGMDRDKDLYGCQVHKELVVRFLQLDHKETGSLEEFKVIQAFELIKAAKFQVVRTAQQKGARDKVGNHQCPNTVITEFLMHRQAHGMY